MHKLDKVKLPGTKQKTTSGMGRVLLNNSYIITCVGKKYLNYDFLDCTEILKTPGYSRGTSEGLQINLQIN